MDSRGNIYYTDLKHIWKKSIDGQLSIAVKGVHSHELFIDTNDNLYGEHLWYSGEETNRWFRYLWCLKNDNTFIKLNDSLEGFNVNNSFIRDSDGNMYWSEQQEVSDSVSFIKYERSGNKVLIAKSRFQNIRWLFPGPGNNIYFLDMEDLYMLTSDGQFKLIAKDLAQGTWWTFLFGNDHSVFGIWFDDENIYVAVYSDKCVKQILPSGDVSIIYHSGLGAPVAGLFDKKGQMQILEYISPFTTRLVEPELTSISNAELWFKNNVVNTYTILFVLFIAIDFVFRRRFRLHGR